MLKIVGLWRYCLGINSVNLPGASQSLAAGEMGRWTFRAGCHSQETNNFGGSIFHSLSSMAVNAEPQLHPRQNGPDVRSAVGRLIIQAGKPTDTVSWDGSIIRELDIRVDNKTSSRSQWPTTGPAIQIAGTAR